MEPHIFFVSCDQGASVGPTGGGSRSLLRPGNYVTLVNHAYPGAAGLSPEAVFHMPEQRAGLSESVTEAEHERTRVRLMNELYEVILLRRAKGVTNDRHLAMRGQRHRTCQAGGAHCPVAGLFKDGSSRRLQISIPRRQQYGLVHRVFIRRQSDFSPGCPSWQMKKVIVGQPPHDRHLSPFL
jgi:hypothetical protein